MPGIIYPYRKTEESRSHRICELTDAELEALLCDISREVASESASVMKEFLYE